jgi:signal transduction histidine kinase
LSAPSRRSVVSLIHRLIEANRTRPVPEMLHYALDCLVDELEARAAFIGRIEDRTVEVVDAVCAGPPEIVRGDSMPLDAFLVADGALDRVTNLRDASRHEAYVALPMRDRFQVRGYLGVPIGGPPAQPWGTLAILARGPRVFSVREVELAEVVAALIAQRLEAPASTLTPNPARTPISMVRLASRDVEEPLAVLRGYADMLSRNEVAAADLPLVARRLLTESETVIRTVDQVLIMARLPLELAFSVRVPLHAVAHSVAEQIRGQVEQQGMELRLQLDTQGEVWGDATLLEAALDEMVRNVLRHAPQSTVIQIRLRGAGRDRLQLIVKDDGPGMSADRLAQLFAPAASQDPPLRGQGVGLYLLRRVAEAHGGSTWANSLEGKGTTFYLELPAASPDGDSVRVRNEAQSTPA